MVFGGCLLFGGCVVDLFGCCWVYWFGMVLFVLVLLVGGFSISVWLLIVVWVV